MNCTSVCVKGIRGGGGKKSRTVSGTVSPGEGERKRLVSHNYFRNNSYLSQFTIPIWLVICSAGSTKMWIEVCHSTWACAHVFHICLWRTQRHRKNFIGEFYKWLVLAITSKCERLYSAIPPLQFRSNVMLQVRMVRFRSRSNYQMQQPHSPSSALCNGSI